MPPLNQRQEPLDSNAYTRVSPPPPPATPNWQPGFNANMRCPVPPTSFTPDTSQQFYRGNTLPQFRAFAPATLTGITGSAGSGSTITNVTETSSGSSSTTTTTVTLTPKTASVTTAVISSGQNFTGILQTSRMFAIQSVTASGAARIRVYATAAAQTADLSRTSAQSPAYGTTQGIIADVTLGASPYMWLLTPVAVGTNGDSPTAPQSYITISQLGSMSGAITATITFLPLEN